MTDDMLTCEEAAPVLRLSVESVRRMVRERRIAAVKVGRRYLIRRAELDRILEEGTQPPQPVTLAGGRTFSQRD